MRDAARRAARLVEVGVWERMEGGYLVRSWTKIHESSEERGRALKADRERKAKARVVQDGVQLESDRNPTGQTTDGVPESLSLIQDRTGQDIEQRTDTAARKDELFEAVAAVCGITIAELTKTSRGPLNGTVAQLRSVGATPNQVKVRANRYRQRYPDTSLTPSALAKHWPSLAEQVQNGRGVSGGW
jgi:hypothetical protein